MTPQELKSSILQLAVQGKLVEQRPEEGTAEELYQQIQEEKQRLIKEEKQKKEKPLPKITEDEMPFDIPESWKWVRWGMLSNSIQYGYNASALPSGNIKMVRISDIQNDRIQWESVPYCNIDKDDIPTYLLRENDILFARTGGTVGKSYIVKDVHEKAIYAGYLIRTQYSSLLCPEYMKHFMGSELYWQQLRNGTIATAQPNCNGKTLAKMILPLPPLAEQKRIVAKIEELLPYIDRYEKAWSRLEELNKRFPEDMQKSVLQMAIQGKLVEQRPEEGTAEELYQQIQTEKQKLIAEGKIKKEKPLPEITEDEVPFEIPTNWMWARLGNISDKLTDGSHNPPPNTGSGYPVISAKNVKNGLISFENVDRYTDKAGFDKENPRTNISYGDIIMGIIGGSIGNIGIYLHNEKVIAQRSIAIIHTLINSDYLMIILRCPYIQNLMHAVAAGSAQGGVYLGTLKKLLIPLPPLAEQKRIVEKLEEILPLCEKLK